MSLVGSMINRFGKTYTVYRDKNAEATLKGKRVPDLYTKISIVASIQPFIPDEIIEDAAGSERDRQAVTIYTETELLVVNEKTRKKADLVEYQGEKYEVRQVYKNVENKMQLAHYQCVAWKIKEELPA